MAVTYKELLARASRGYDWLLSDEAKLMNFDVDSVNPDMLDLSCGSDCVLAQASGFGDYDEALNWLDVNDYPVVTVDDRIRVRLDTSWGAREPEYSLVSVWERHHGFNLTPGDGDFWGRIEVYRELTQAWRQVIKERRDA